MKKRVGMILLGATAIVMLAGCGDKKYDNNSLSLTDIDVDYYVTELGDYSSLDVTAAPKEEITDATVDEYIDYLMNSRATAVKTEKTTVESGDIVNIDYVGTLNGVAFDGGTAQGYDLAIGSGSFIPGFEDGLIGAKVGDEVKLNLTFPEQYQSAELAGQDTVFTVKVNYISENKAPEFTDEFVTELGVDGVTTVAQFREYVFNKLDENATTTYETALKDSAMQVLLESSTLIDEYPETLLKYYQDQLKSADSAKATNYGMDVETYVKSAYAMTMDEYNTKIDDQAKLMVKDALVCAKIARLEGIEVTDKEYEQQIADDAVALGYSSVDDFKQNVKMDDYKNYLLELKVMDKLLENANITE